MNPNKEKIKKRLRIGVIDSNMVIDEFIVKKNSVTIGSSNKNDIVIKDELFIKQYKLFSIKDSSIELHLNGSIKATIDSNSIKDDKTIKITEENRGKIELSNGLKILFQFIEISQEEKLPKRLPKEFRKKMRDYIDWKFITPLVLSFLIHAISVSWMQSLDLSSVEVISMNKIPDRFREVIIQENIKEKVVTETKTDGENSQKLKVKNINKKNKRVKEISNSESIKNSTIKNSTIKKSKMLTAITKLRKGNGGGLGGFSNDTNEELVLSELEVSSDNYSGYSNSENSVMIRGNSAFSNLPNRTIVKNDKIGVISNNIKENRVIKESVRKRVAIINVEQNVEVPVDTTLNKISARKAISKSQIKVERCYQRETKKNYSFKGRITILITIGLDGKPISIDIINPRMNNSMLEKSLTKCIKKKLKRVVFPRPSKSVQVKFTAAFTST